MTETAAAPWKVPHPPYGHPLPEGTAIKLSGDSVNHAGWAVPTIRMRFLVGTAHPTSHSLNLTELSTKQRYW